MLQQHPEGSALCSRTVTSVVEPATGTCRLLSSAARQFNLDSPWTHTLSDEPFAAVALGLKLWVSLNYAPFNAKRFEKEVFERK